MGDAKLFNPDVYDREYFEDGMCTGKSCYTNYRWMPELTIKMAHNFIKYLNLTESDKVLDYGCSKGYLVKALRILDIDAYGCDISEYALESVDSDARDYCRLIKNDSLIPFDSIKFDWIVSKDVFEHMSEENIDVFLDCSFSFAKKMFHIIPLGDNGVFRIPEYHHDTSHIRIHDEKWWTKKFEEYDWKIISFDYRVRGIKDNWTKKYEKGNGFFTLERKS